MAKQNTGGYKTLTLLVLDFKPKITGTIMPTIFRKAEEREQKKT